MHPRRAVLDGVFYVVKTGCQWRQLPADFPPWRTVYHYFRAWRRAGVWERLCGALVARLRRRAGRDPRPGAGVIDSQSVKTTGVGGVRGWDAHKRVKGRKRHVLVDGQGLLLRIVVHSAALQDRAGLPLLLAGARERFPRLRHVWVDRGYSGTAAAWIARELGWTVDVPQYPTRRAGWVPGWTTWTPDRPPHERQTGWVRVTPQPWGPHTLRPRRWVVERAFAWLGHARRLAKDYERLCPTAEAVAYAAFTRLLARRLARA